MDRRERFEEAVGTVSLGLLADDVVLATLRYQRTSLVGDLDKSALEDAKRVLTALSELGTGFQAPAFSAMASFEGLDEAFDTLNTVKPTAEDLRSFAIRLSQAIQRVLDKSADDQTVQLVLEVFERLARLTFTRSEELAKPARSG